MGENTLPVNILDRTKKGSNDYDNLEADFLAQNGLPMNRKTEGK